MPAGFKWVFRLLCRPAKIIRHIFISNGVLQMARLKIDEGSRTQQEHTRRRRLLGDRRVNAAQDNTLFAKTMACLFVQDFDTGISIDPFNSWSCCGRGGGGCSCAMPVMLILRLPHRLRHRRCCCSRIRGIIFLGVRVIVAVVVGCSLGGDAVVMTDIKAERRSAAVALTGVQGSGMVVAEEGRRRERALGANTVPDNARALTQIL
ncbi:hypothetical protein EI94DRAFT_1788702 [Lactarius quietus]|nr:hypothetical protein EI94DRAFT_1788702 [Lactarius quietus]